jgi:hypothetical protein
MPNSYHVLCEHFNSSARFKECVLEECELYPAEFEEIIANVITNTCKKYIFVSTCKM